MPELTITSKGQITLRREALRHLGLNPGDKVEYDLQPGARISFHPPRKKNGSIEDFIGCLAGKTDIVRTIDEIDEAAANGWAGIR